MAKEKKHDFDEFDDDFVDRDDLAEIPNSFNDGGSDGDGSDDGDEDDERNDILVEVVVLNVDITGSDDCRILRFDTIEYSSNGARYGSRYYCLDFGLGTNGLFDMLDEYFIGRFHFLHSSKSCQEFLTAMADVEGIFRDKHGVNFFEMCKRMNGEIIESLKGSADDDDDDDDDVLWGGYGISAETLRAFKTRRSALDGIDFKTLNSELVKRFNFYREYVETKHFCAFCVQYSDEYVRPNVVEDPTLSRPFIAYIPKFAETVCEKVAHNYLSTDVFQDMEIGEMKVDLYLLMPSATASDMKTVYGKDLKVKDFDGLEDLDFVMGKYKTYTFTEEEYAEREDSLDSMICFS